MTEYPLPALTRRCHATGRDLRPGERYYGVLLEEAAGVVRRDFAAEQADAAAADDGQADALAGLLHVSSL